MQYVEGGDFHTLQENGVDIIWFSGNHMIDIPYHARDNRKTIMFDPPLEAHALKILWVPDEDGKLMSYYTYMTDACWTIAVMDFSIYTDKNLLHSPVGGTCADSHKFGIESTYRFVEGYKLFAFTPAAGTEELRLKIYPDTDPTDITYKTVTVTIVDEHLTSGTLTKDITTPEVFGPFNNGGLKV